MNDADALVPPVHPCEIWHVPLMLLKAGWLRVGTPEVFMDAIHSFVVGPADSTPPRAEDVGAGITEFGKAPVLKAGDAELEPLTPNHEFPDSEGNAGVRVRVRTPVWLM